MSKDLSDIACAIAGPITTRTLENLRRHLEDLYIKSTAQESTPEESAAFNPELIARAHQAAMADNAQTVVQWARAIYAQLEQEDKAVAHLERLQIRLWHLKHRRKSFQRDIEKIRQATPSTEDREQAAAATERALQATEKEILSLESELRDLPGAQTIPGYSPPPGPSREYPSGRGVVDGDL